MSPVTDIDLKQSATKSRVGYYRWGICALLLFGAIINYIDRQVIGILKPTLVEAFGWSDERIYGSIVFSFQLAYALGFMAAGRVMDTLGVRRGFALAVTLWSIAAVAHGAANWVTTLSVPVINLDAKTGFAVLTLTGAAAGLALARFALGLGEAGSFPASIKTVAEWFPKKERALATGIFNSGTNVGALLTPLIVPWIAQNLGWQWAFVGTACWAFSGRYGGLQFIAHRIIIHGSRRPNWHISAAIRPIRMRRSHGENYCLTARRGRSPSANS
jgi:ACS family hexuronate transporter-like MFS transporter